MSAFVDAFQHFAQPLDSLRPVGNEQKTFDH